MTPRHALVLSAYLLTSVLAARADVRFDLDVRPILSDACFACHGPDEAAGKADLRLDREDGVARVVEGGSPATSEMYRRVSASDPRDRMPPPQAQRSLTDVEIATLRQWIEEGARHQRHWSLEPAPTPDAPPVARADWPGNDLDRF
ncbi:hypothetical protein HOK31_16040, partial [Candidatus Poribacteria bacterium]|nr:hypothetical protein [Candidatus Poribacteria bacterium]